MCRLFGMSGGHKRVAATFWLLDAPDSLSAQSRREPDGTGLGTYDERDAPVVVKHPLAAYEDRQFACLAKRVRSRTFIAHIRYASTGAVARENTHPFEQDGRLFAHNGVVAGLPQLEAELGPTMASVHGDTDSERVFALITREISRTGGDVSAGIVRAAEWVASELPLYALNIVLTTASELWALRYPDTHELHVLERDAGGGALEHAGSGGTVRVRAEELDGRPAVIVASEPMDDDPGWRALASGDLLHVDPDLEATVTNVLDRPPAHPLSLADHDPHAAASQGHRTLP
jgi:glutamine amidotransferase